MEDDYKGDVSKKGHGLQRVFILALLQHLAIVKGTKQIDEQEDVSKSAEAGVTARDGGTAKGTTIPNLVFAIEEPELYQHPNRQRQLANVFLQLCESSLVDGERVQILYSTHSPLFVGIERFDKIRLFKKERVAGGLPKETRIKLLAMGQIAQKLEEATGLAEGTFTTQSLKARLSSLMTSWVNEGFFANVVALVEGESDQCAILETARQMDVDFEKAGISVIPVRGKTNVAIPFLIFAELGIPVYIVFDADNSEGNEAKPETNKLLLRLGGYPEEEFPKTRVEKNLACFEEDLETVLSDAIGQELYGSLLKKYRDELGYKAKKGEKNPLVVTKIVQNVYDSKKNIPILENVVNFISALKNN